MSTVDASGAIHAADGRFAGHVAGESGADLADDTAPQPLSDLGVTPDEPFEIDSYDLGDPSILGARIVSDTDGALSLEVDRDADVSALGWAPADLESRRPLLDHYAAVRWGGTIGDIDDDIVVSVRHRLEAGADTSSIGEVTSQLQHDQFSDDRDHHLAHLEKYLLKTDTAIGELNYDLADMRRTTEGIEPGSTPARGELERLHQQARRDLAAEGELVTRLPSDWLRRRQVSLTPATPGRYRIKFRAD